MNLPKKKVIRASGHDYALDDLEEYRDVKNLEYEIVLDSEGMKQLADLLDKYMWKLNAKNARELLIIIKFLRGE
jgi:hypothetical protein